MQKDKTFPLCSATKKAYLVCINQQCKHRPFLCRQEQCQCQKYHIECEKLAWSFIEQKLDNTFLKATPEFKLFVEKTDNVFKNLTTKVTKAQQQYKQWKLNFGYTEKEETFVALLRQKKYEDINSRMLSEIRREIKLDSIVLLKKQEELQLNINLIDIYTESMLAQVSRLYKNVKAQKRTLKVEPSEIKISKPDLKNEAWLRDAVDLINGNQNQNGNSLVAYLNEGIIENKFKEILNNKKIDKSETQLYVNTEVYLTTLQILAREKIQVLEEDLKMIHFHNKVHRYQFLDIIQEDEPTVQLLDRINEHFENRRNILKVMRLDLLEHYKNPKQNLNLIKELNQKMLRQILNSEINIQDELITYKEKCKQKIQKSRIFAFASFFAPKEIKNMTLLYKASENHFLASVFHEKCDIIPDTVVIAKTEFGKIIGGYTPLKWDKNKHNYEKDQNKQSFLFSITQKTKMVSTGKNAIFSDPMYGPTFGSSHQLYISNKANVDSSYMYIGDGCYIHPDYSLKQQSYTRLSGQTNGYKFLIKEWQVYQIEFKP